MLFRRNPATSRAKVRKTKTQKQQKVAKLFVALFLGIFASVFAFNVIAEIIDGNDVRVDVDSDLTYYLSVKEDGIDVHGVESSDSQIAEVHSGRVTVTDKIPEGLIFQGFVTTSDGTIGATSRSDSSIQCPGKVIDDTNEATLDSGTWNNAHTEYYYHGLHYNDTTRTVSFVAEKIKAGCELTVGIITKTPATVDDPDTAEVETRRDFYNKAFAAEKDVTAISNTVHAYIGSSSTHLYTVSYSYTGDVPTGAPTAPGNESYPSNATVGVSTSPTLEGYTFSGWTTTDATITNGTFSMPSQNVQLVGIWTKNPESTKYTVAYVVNGDKPADFMPPAQKEYEAGVTVNLDSTEANAVIDGYRFSGWSTTDTTLSETGFVMPANNVTIVGSFTRVSYTVCYEFEGAILPPNPSSLLPACETHYPGDTVTTAANPTATGYEFLGWYKNATFTMPESNVVIQGEWMRELGKFAPTITKTIVNPKDKYMYGETVQFKITVTNTAAFEIADVYLEGKLPGAVFTEPQDSSYTVKTSTIAVIPSIAAGASVDVYAEYKVTENIAQTLTNIVELTGALADGHVLDTDQDYEAEVEFETEPEPVPFTGIIFNALPYIGLIAIGTGVLAGLVLLSRKFSINTKTIRRTGKAAFRYALPGIIAATFVFGGLMIRSAIAAPYTEVIKSVEITSQHTSYTNNEPGSWNVTKSAEWIEQGKARITFNVDTITKVADNTHLDLIMVLDNSGSMSGGKIAQVKHDATELIESVLADTNNRIGLVSFASGASKLSDLTADKTLLIDLIDNLDPAGSTNYYGGFKKAEEALEGYTKQSDRELIMLFLTDGYPNEKTPNEVAEYRTLKRMYPYMTINGIQYEMGDEALDPIKQVSDNQFIANMDSLNNVLFEASIAPYVYDNFTLTDYINDEYWDVDSIDAIEASIGEVALTYDGDMPVVTWTMNEALVSGLTAQLSIDIALKDASAIAESTLLPTNNHETIQSSLPETPNENITSDSTPVLKSSYKVTYEPNLPSGCSTYTGTLPAEQSYLPMAIVEKSSNELSCDGYNFNGWEIATGSPKVINDDYFKVMNDDVVLRATWTKVSISKSMDGEVKEEAIATLDTGQNINATLKQLSGQGSATATTSNTTIKAVKAATSMSVPQQASASVISSSNSPVPVYAWFDDTDGTIYIYSEADQIMGNANMGYLFNELRSLEDVSAIANWNVSNMTDMKWMFRRNYRLTNISALSNWDTHNVKIMSSVFEANSSLVDISGLSNWDTSSVTDMYYLFYGASSLADISALANWDTSNVKRMSCMFYGNSSLTNIDALANWDTSSATTMGDMFRGASSLTNIDGAAGWDTSSVTSMGFMFHSASSLTNIDGAASWNTSNVTDMHCMFEGARNLADIDGATNWNTSSVTNMSNMFSGASSLTSISALSSWNTSNVTNMSYMFRSASNLTNNNGASGWDTSSVTNMSYMFSGATSLIDVNALAGWVTSSVLDMSYMFNGTSSLTNISGLANWNTSSVTDMSYTFSRATALANVSALASWNTAKVTNLNGTFSGAYYLTDISGLASWSTVNVEMMSTTFSGATRLSNISALSGWNTAKVTTMSGMFSSTYALTDISALSGWDTSKVAYMGRMFDGSAITNIDGAAGWITSSVTDMTNMFYASAITNIDGAADWDTSNVVYMENMFNSATSLIDIDGAADWDTSSVTTMAGMFRGATSLSDISGVNRWVTSNVETMANMFYNDINIASLQPTFNWTVSASTTKTDMFYNIPSSVQRPDWYQ